MSVKQWEGPVLALLTGRVETQSETYNGYSNTATTPFYDYYKYTWVELEPTPEGSFRRAKPGREGTKYKNFAIELGNNKVGIPDSNDGEGANPDYLFSTGPIVFLYAMQNSGGNLVYFFQYNPLLVSTFYHTGGQEPSWRRSHYGQPCPGYVQENYNTAAGTATRVTLSSNLLTFGGGAFVNPTYQYAYPQSLADTARATVSILPASGGDFTAYDGFIAIYPVYPQVFEGVVTDGPQYFEGEKSFNTIQVEYGIGLGTPYKPGTGERSYERMMNITNITKDDPAKIYYSYRNDYGGNGLYVGDTVELIGILGPTALNATTVGKRGQSYRYLVTSVTRVGYYDCWATLEIFDYPTNRPLNGSGLPAYQGGGVIYRKSGTVDAVKNPLEVDTGVYLTGVNTELVGNCFVSKVKQGSFKIKAATQYVHMMASGNTGYSPSVGLSAQPTTNIHNGEAAIWAGNSGTNGNPKVNFRSILNGSITGDTTNNTSSFGFVSGDGFHSVGASGDAFFIYGVTRNYSDNTNTNGGTGVTVKTSTGMKFYGGIYIGGASQAVTVSGYMGL